MRRTQSRAAIAGAVGLACLLIFAASASAYDDPPVKLGAESANLPDTTGLVVENSPREISGVNSTSTTESMYQAETDTSASYDAATSTELGSEVDSMLAETGAWDWALAPELVLGAGAGWVGWEIGSAIYGTFFDEAGPSEGPGWEDTYYLADEWHVIAPHEYLYGVSGKTGEEEYEYQVFSPATWGMWGAGSVGGSLGEINDEEKCENILYGDGIRLYSPVYPTEYCGTHSARTYALWRPLGPLKCTLTTCEGIETVPYEYNNQPTAPTAEAMQEKTQEGLEGEGYPVLNRFLNHEMEPENYPDPRVTSEENDHRCDRAPGPRYENPGGNGSPEPFAKVIEAPFSITNRPEGFGETEVFLRWGTTYWQPGREGFGGTAHIDDWGGWGYRHIVAKHGWSALDRVETELALTTGVPIPTAKEGKYVYETPEIGKGVGGVECTRRVVVDFQTGEGDPSPRGIVTSFNKIG